MNQTKENMVELLKGLPPNYPVGGIYLNGVLVPTFNFSNVCDRLAYFSDGEGQVLVVDVTKVDGINFGETDEFF